MLTEPDYLTAIDYCFRNWRVRLMPRTSRLLIRQCLNLMPLTEQRGDVWLRGKMTYEARAAAHRVWRPVKSAWLLLLLQVVLPAIIRLVLKWWLNRKTPKLSLQEARDTGCCRICGGWILEPGSEVSKSTGYPEGWKDNLDEMVYPVEVTLKYGREFAHPVCLEMGALA